MGSVPELPHVGYDVLFPGAAGEGAIWHIALSEVGTSEVPHPTQKRLADTDFPTGIRMRAAGQLGCDSRLSSNSYTSGILSLVTRWSGTYGFKP